MVHLVQTNVYDRVMWIGHSAEDAVQAYMTGNAWISNGPDGRKMATGHGVWQEIRA